MNQLTSFICISPTFNAAFASFKSLPATSPTLGINPTNAMA
ncbi:hypothetical protein [Gilliamella apis]|nr:hypothetical protein [Gilliamella apis]